MNISELCIRRPAMTVLLSAAVVVIGIFAYFQIPVAALPSYNTPVINVIGAAAGRQPRDHGVVGRAAARKAVLDHPGPADHQLGQHPGRDLGHARIRQPRDIDAAAVDVQAALLRAQRQLPAELTQLPSYRKVNPADAPVLFIAMVSNSMTPAELNDYAENLISPTLSTIDGVAQVAVYGRSASRCASRPTPTCSTRATSRSTNSPTRCGWPTPTRRSACSTARARRSRSRPTSRC